MKIIQVSWLLTEMDQEERLNNYNWRHSSF